MKQQTFSDIEYSNRRRKTRRGVFLETMDALVPWSELVEMIRPYYYKNKRGRRPKDLEAMLRMYLLQSWFNLSSEGIEEAIYDSYSMRSFLRINFVEEQVPDATTLLRFRRLIEDHELEEKISDVIRAKLDEKDLVMHEGNVVEAIVFTAPNAAKKK